MRCKRLVLCLSVLLLGLVPIRAAASEQIIASISQGLSVDGALLRECPLGDYMADALRAGTKARIALVPAELLQEALAGDGSVTATEADAVLREDCEVYMYSLSAAQLKALLEEGVSHWQLNERERLDEEACAYGEFLQISGFSMTADATAPVGERVLSVTLGGEPLDLTSGEETITAAIPAVLKIDSAGTSAGKTAGGLLREYIESQGAVALEETDRIRVIGDHEKDIITIIPAWFFGLLVVVLLANFILTKRRRDEAA